MKVCRLCHRTHPNNFAVCPADGTPLSQQGEWSEGTLIRGKYCILEKLGQGAMGAWLNPILIWLPPARPLVDRSRKGCLSNDPVLLQSIGGL